MRIPATNLAVSTMTSGRRQPESLASNLSIPNSPNGSSNSLIPSKLSTAEELRLRRAGLGHDRGSLSNCNTGSAPIINAIVNNNLNITNNTRAFLPSKSSISSDDIDIETTTRLLRPTTKTQLADAEESMAWAEKKWIWVECDKEGYIAAHTVEIKNNKTVVLQKNGIVCANID